MHSECSAALSLLDNFTREAAHDSFHRREQQLEDAVRLAVRNMRDSVLYMAWKV